MGGGNYLRLGAAVLACILFSGDCRDTREPQHPPGSKNRQSITPSKPQKTELSLDDLDYVSREDVGKAFAELEKLLREHGVEPKKVSLEVAGSSLGSGDLRVCSAADFSSNTIRIYNGNLEAMAESCLQTFLDNRDELERIMKNPFALEKYNGEGALYLKLKDALFYRALGSPDAYSSPEDFKKAYKRLCFLDFLVAGASELNDGIAGIEGGLYEEVFDAHRYARGRHFSGIVLGSFDEAWPYFAVGRACDMVHFGYDDSHRNGGCKTLEMFVSSLTAPKPRKRVHEIMGIKYEKFDRTGNPRYLFMQIVRIPTSAIIRRQGRVISETKVLEEVFRSNLRAYYRGMPLKDNMDRMMEAARAYLNTIEL